MGRTSLVNRASETRPSCRNPKFFLSTVIARSSESTVSTLLWLGIGSVLGNDPRWINFYGCNPKSSGLKELREGLKKAKGRFTKDGYKDEREYQNKYPAAGVCYKGRALISFALEPVQKAKPSKLASSMLNLFGKLEPECEKIDFSRPPCPPRKERGQKGIPALPDFLATKLYHLSVLLISGVEIPFGGQNISVVVSVGRYELHSAPAGNNNGFCVWNSIWVRSVGPFWVLAP